MYTRKISKIADTNTYVLSNITFLLSKYNKVTARHTIESNNCVALQGQVECNVIWAGNQDVRKPNTDERPADL